MVYLRGNHLDYDHWNYLGNQGWAYQEVLPYFKKSETNKQFHGEFHGDHGPLSVESVSDGSLLKRAFIETAAGCGFKGDANWDFNGAKQEGVAGLYQKTLKNGVNHSVGAAYLTPFLGRPNLEPRPFSLATKLMWDRDRVWGVEYLSIDWDSNGNSLVRYLPGLWKLRTARARREVIVSAGVVESPQLLMLSGIGPAEHLRRHGIPVKVDLPGVGQNLYDHLSVTLTYKPNSNAGAINDRIGSMGLLLRTQNGFPSASPDLQLVIVEVVVTQAAFGLQPGPLYFCAVNGVKPHSVGSISLASADPVAPPLIRANYLQCESDLRTMIDGVRLIRRLTQSEPLRKMLDAELVPGPECRTDEQISAAIRQTATTGFHPVGSCKMGHDAMAVVDDQLKVHGVEGLRVADASIMPSIVNTNTIGPCVMIGEKAAEIIRTN
jgi:choline dehydrogenase